MNIEAKLIPYTEVPHKTFVPLQNWMGGFEFKSAALNTHVAVAGNEKADPIVSVCYMKVDDAFLITALVVNPKASAEEKNEASQGIDRLLESQAQLAGVTKLFLVKPGANECEDIATYTPRITQVSRLQPPSPVFYIN
jgi:hypothetical protein